MPENFRSVALLCTTQRCPSPAKPRNRAAQQITRTDPAATLHPHDRHLRASSDTRNAPNPHPLTSAILAGWCWCCCRRLHGDGGDGPALGLCRASCRLRARRSTALVWSRSSRVSCADVRRNNRLDRSDRPDLHQPPGSQTPLSALEHRDRRAAGHCQSTEQRPRPHGADSTPNTVTPTANTE